MVFCSNGDALQIKGRVAEFPPEGSLTLNAADFAGVVGNWYEAYCDRESAATQKCKMAAMTSSNSSFEKPRKKTLANICQIICRKFN